MKNLFGVKGLESKREVCILPKPAQAVVQTCRWNEAWSWFFCCEVIALCHCLFCLCEFQLKNHLHLTVVIVEIRFSKLQKIYILSTCTYRITSGDQNFAVTLVTNRRRCCWMEINKLLLGHMEMERLLLSYKFTMWIMQWRNWSPICINRYKEGWTRTTTIKNLCNI